MIRLHTTADPQPVNTPIGNALAFPALSDTGEPCVLYVTYILTASKSLAQALHKIHPPAHIKTSWIERTYQTPPANSNPPTDPKLN